MNRYTATFQIDGEGRTFVSIFFARSEDEARRDAQSWADSCDDATLLSLYQEC